MKQLILIALIVTGSVGLEACSVKASDVAPETPAAPKKPEVKGPDLSGNWSSGCQRSAFGEYKTFDVVFTNATISRKTVTFSDANCQDVSDTKNEVGTYRFVQANKDGSFNVEYKISLGNGASVLPQEKVLLENGVLYLSDYALGDSIGKDMMIPLHRVAAAGGK